MKSPDTILIIDTTLGACNIALKTSDRVKSKTEIMTFGQAERLVPMIEELLSEEQMTYQDLNAISATTGPGGFTGLRVGLATARSLALALDIPLMGLSTFEAIIGGYNEDLLKEENLIVIDSRREELFIQSFTKDKKPMSKPEIKTAKEILNGLNDQTQLITNLETLNGQHIQYANLETLCRFMDKNPDILIENPEPLYMRGADVSTPKKKQRRLKSTS